MGGKFVDMGRQWRLGSACDGEGGVLITPLFILVCRRVVGVREVLLWVDDDEVLGDEEMMAYIKKQQAKKLATGVSQADLDEMLRFPEPIPPANPSSPAGTCLE